MKLTTFLILLTCVQVSATGVAQERVSISEKDVSLEKVFSIITKQTGYAFFFSDKQMEKAKRISINVKEASVKEVLDACLKDQPLGYNIEGKTIFIININKKESISNLSIGRLLLISINGKVVNDNGEPVVATILVKGTTKGTETTEDGLFSLSNIDEKAILIISGIGIETTEITVNGRTNLLISVKIAIGALEETVIKGYYTTSKRLNTGNVTTIRSDEIQKQPISNPLQALQGRVPGMVVTQNTGVPGGGFTVQIRGKNSIANGNDPLYVIDGVPYSSQLLESVGSSVIGVGNPLNYLNPSHIESIDILKDADATAIYGSRGANGVVLITTKKGKLGKTKLNFNTYTGIGKVTRKMSWLNTQQYLNVRKQAFQNDNATPNEFNAPDILVWDTTRYTDWQKELIGGTAKITDAQLSFSGGTENLQYVLGGGYHKESTVFPDDGSDKKVSAHFSMANSTLNQKLKTQVAINYIIDNNSLPRNDLTSLISQTPPNAPEIYNNDGTLNWENSTWTNPFSLLKSRYKSKTNNLIASANLSFEIFRGLTIKANAGYTNMRIDEVAMFPSTTYNPSYNLKPNSSFVNNIIESWILEPQLTYNKSFGKSNFEFLIGTTFQQNNQQGQRIDAKDYENDIFLENMKAAPTITVNSLTSILYKYNALFSRLNYNYAGKYLINITGRRDGSSRFGPEKQFHSFGAVGAAWIFTKENFAKKYSSFISFGKVKGSYGTTGNDQVGDYGFYNLFDNSFYAYQNTVGLNPTRLFNPELAWEETKKLEGGLELGFLNDRILVGVSYYRNRSGNQLVNYSLPATTGFPSISKNLPAIVENNGWEFTSNILIVNNPKFKWTNSFNITISKNKLLDFPNIDNSAYSTLYLIGWPITITKVFHLLGVDPSTGLYAFSDVQGNPTSNPSFTTNKTAIINTAPKFFGGFQNSFQFKRFSLDIFLQFVKQVGPNYIFGSNVLPGYRYNQPQFVLNQWQKPGDESSIQRYSQSLASNAYSVWQNAKNFSDAGFSDASFIRLKNLSLSYQLPIKGINKSSSSNLNLYIHCQNLLTVTNYKGMDPENQSISSLPPLTVISFGIQLTL